MLALRPLSVIFLAIVATAAASYQSSTKETSTITDPMELVTGATQAAVTPQERFAALALLDQASQNSNLYAPGTPPFTLKVSFDSSGDSLYTGAGEMEETQISHARGRWTARIGDFSQIRIYDHGRAFDEKTAAGMPLRLQMVRGAILWPMHVNSTRMAIRTASATWKGKAVTCVLLSGPASAPTSTPGRRWEETESCIDPVSNLMLVHSEVPGIHAAYDFADALHFHGRTLARQISISEGNRTVLQVRIASVEDAATADDNLFKPTEQMLAQGPAAFMAGPFRFSQFTHAPAGEDGAIQPVVVHASIDDHGKVLEAEVLQDSDPTLAQTALNLVRQSEYGGQAEDHRPTQREAFISVRFVTQQ